MYNSKYSGQEIEEMLDNFSSVATAQTDGLMSKEDKEKLDNLSVADVKDPNFTKPVTNPDTGDTEQKAMTQGEINLQFRDNKQDYSGLHIVDNKLCMYAPAPTTQSNNN